MRNGKLVMSKLISCNYKKNHDDSAKDVDIGKINYCVYFVTDSDAIKIGVAASLPTRIKQLQTGNPRKIKALYVIPAENQREALRIENELHAMFLRYRICGEWFSLDKNDLLETFKNTNYELFKPCSKFDYEIDGIGLIQ